MSNRTPTAKVRAAGYWFVEFFIRSFFMLLLITMVMVFAIYGLVMPHK